MKQSKIIGLTGNSGCGKGAVGEILKSIGGIVIDCDCIAHENMEKNGGIAYNEIVDAFGSEILDDDGEINRKSLGKIVFNDSNKLKMLNKITHCHIRNRVKAIAEENADSNFIVIDAPLLKEAGLLEMTDSVWLVTAREDIRLERVMKRDNITEQQARDRFKNQIPFDAALADVVVENNFENFDLLRREVLEIAVQQGLKNWINGVSKLWLNFLRAL